MVTINPLPISTMTPADERRAGEGATGGIPFGTPVSLNQQPTGSGEELGVCCTLPGNAAERSQFSPVGRSALRVPSSGPEPFPIPRRSPLRSRTGMPSPPFRPVTTGGPPPSAAPPP